MCDLWDNIVFNFHLYIIKAYPFTEFTYNISSYFYLGEIHVFLKLILKSPTSHLNLLSTLQVLLYHLKRVCISVQALGCYSVVFMRIPNRGDFGVPSHCDVAQATPSQSMEGLPWDK